MWKTGYPPLIAMTDYPVLITIVHRWESLTLIKPVALKKTTALNKKQQFVYFVLSNNGVKFVMVSNNSVK